ncbi:MAG: magnetosome magnetite formation protein MamP [Rhodospirillaceae bacterium]
MKHETLISVTILSVVTTVVIGVWSNGFGLFSHRMAMPEPAAVGIHGPIALFPSVNAVNGVDFPGSFQAAAVPAAGTQPFTDSGAGTPIADPTPLDGTLEAVAPKAPNFIPASVQLYEAHWQGMDTRLLTGELRRKLRFPQGLAGLLVGEVSLEAGRSGLLGGDVIVAVEGQPITSLESFQDATRLIADRTRATIEALRKTGPKDRNGNRAAMVRMTLTLVAERPLGFAQVEGAPMIKAGDPRPHPDRGPCTQCHSIGRGFELTPDPDLITLPPPVLSRDQAAKGLRPHEDRGPCQACHVITP